jgi:hypothetical protein
MYAENLKYHYSHFGGVSGRLGYFGGNQRCPLRALVPSWLRPPQDEVRFPRLQKVSRQTHAPFTRLAQHFVGALQRRAFFFSCAMEEIRPFGHKARSALRILEIGEALLA